jgi:hypothetical protein
MLVKTDAYEREIRKLLEKVEEVSTGEELGRISTEQIVFNVEGGNELRLTVDGKEKQLWLVDDKGTIHERVGFSDLKELKEIVRNLDKVFQLEGEELLREWEEFRERVNWEDVLRCCIKGGSAFIRRDGNVSPDYEGELTFVSVYYPHIGINYDPEADSFTWNEEKGVWVNELDGKEVGKCIEDVLLYLLNTYGKDSFREELKEIEHEVRCRFFRNITMEKYKVRWRP